MPFLSLIKADLYFSRFTSPKFEHQKQDNTYNRGKNERYNYYQNYFPLLFYFSNKIYPIFFWSLKSKINFRILSPIQAQPVSSAGSLHDLTGSQHLNRPLFVKNKRTYCQQQNWWITSYGLYQEGQTRWQMSPVFPNSLAAAGKCIYLEGHHLNFLVRLDLWV